MQELIIIITIWGFYWEKEADDNLTRKELCQKNEQE